MLTCFAEDASSYRWTNVLSSRDVEISDGMMLNVSQPGRFAFECTVFLDCGTGVSCPFSKNISGLARGKIYRHAHLSFYRVCQKA